MYVYTHANNNSLSNFFFIHNILTVAAFFVRNGVFSKARFLRKLGGLSDVLCIPKVDDFFFNENDL